MIGRVNAAAFDRLVDQAYAILAFSRSEGVHLDVEAGTDLRDVAVEHALALAGYTEEHGFTKNEITVLSAALFDRITRRADVRHRTDVAAPHRSVHVLTYKHRYDDSMTAYSSRTEALIAGAGIADTWAKECDAETHAKITRLYAEASTDEEHEAIIALYNQAREGDESIEITELQIDPSE